MTLTHVAAAANEAEGLYLWEIAPGEALEVRTQNHLYRIRYLGFGAAEVAGHDKLCPEPMLVNILGSTWGGSALKTGFLGVGMRLELQRPGEPQVIRTSPIQALTRKHPGVALLQDVGRAARDAARDIVNARECQRVTPGRSTRHNRDANVRRPAMDKGLGRGAAGGAADAEPGDARSARLFRTSRSRFVPCTGAAVLVRRCASARRPMAGMRMMSLRRNPPARRLAIARPRRLRSQSPSLTAR